MESPVKSGGSRKNDEKLSLSYHSASKLLWAKYWPLFYYAVHVYVHGLHSHKSHFQFKVTYPVPIRGWISQASKLQTCYKFQECIFLGRQVILIIYAIIKQFMMGFTPSLYAWYGNTLPNYASLRTLARYEAKIAKICNFWTFWPVIQMVSLNWEFLIRT